MYNIQLFSMVALGLQLASTRSVGAASTPTYAQFEKRSGGGGCGSELNDITSLELCQAAAQNVGHADTLASPVSSERLPPGCWYDSSNQDLYFNSASGTNQVFDNDISYDGDWKDGEKCKNSPVFIEGGTGKKECTDLCAKYALENKFDDSSKFCCAFNNADNKCMVSESSSTTTGGKWNAKKGSFSAVTIRPSICDRGLTNKYKIMEDGTCGAGYYAIESESDCEYAAYHLGLDASADIDNLRGKQPHGCFLHHGVNLKFNKAGDEYSTDTSRLALCQAEFTNLSAAGKWVPIGSNFYSKEYCTEMTWGTTATRSDTERTSWTFGLSIEMEYEGVFVDSTVGMSVENQISSAYTVSTSTTETDTTRECTTTNPCNGELWRWELDMTMENTDYSAKIQTDNFVCMDQGSGIAEPKCPQGHCLDSNPTYNDDGSLAMDACQCCSTKFSTEGNWQTCTDGKMAGYVRVE